MTPTISLLAFTHSDVLALVARSLLLPFSAIPRNDQMSLSDTSHNALVGYDPDYVPVIEGAKRVVVLDGEQGTIDVIDLYSTSGPDEMDDNIRVTLGKVAVCG